MGWSDAYFFVRIFDGFILIKLPCRYIEDFLKLSFTLATKTRSLPSVLAKRRVWLREVLRLLI